MCLFSEKEFIGKGPNYWPGHSSQVKFSEKAHDDFPLFEISLNTKITLMLLQ